MSETLLLDEATLSNLAIDIGKDAVAKVLTESVKELDERALALRQALQSMDIIAVKKLAHSIAGIAGTIGALQLRNIATAVELRCDGNLELPEFDQSNLFKLLIAQSVEQLTAYYGQLTADE